METQIKERITTKNNSMHRTSKIHKITSLIFKMMQFSRISMLKNDKEFSK